MTSSLIDYPPPDVEANLVETIKAAGFTGVRVFTVDVTTGYPHWVTDQIVQVDCRASDKQKAYAKAWAVLSTILTPTTWRDGVLSHVAVASGPSWQPDENGAPRYVARYILTVHPARNEQNR